MSLLRRQALILSGHWRESLRYRSSDAQVDELAEVCESVDWIVANAPELWR